jgi:shikimate dehydrogenase
VNIYGLVGRPVGHSLSPALHNWGFARHKLPAVYQAWEVAPEDLADWARKARRLPLQGASVTIPHKEAVLALLDGLTPAARRVGAVNTIFRQNDSFLGDNTDVLGCVHALRGHVPARALILGAGGVARAVLAGLERIGVREILVAARSLEKAAPLAREFPCRLIPWEDRAAALPALKQGLLVNATPLGLRGPLAGQSPIAEGSWPDLVPGSALACDTVYIPKDTLFLRQARAHGWRAVDGLAFFLAQALAQFQLWTGLTLPLDEARSMLSGILQQENFPPRAVRNEPLLFREDSV